MSYPLKPVVLFEDNMPPKAEDVSLLSQLDNYSDDEDTTDVVEPTKNTTPNMLYVDIFVKNLVQLIIKKQPDILPKYIVEGKLF